MPITRHISPDNTTKNLRLEYRSRLWGVILDGVISLLLVFDF